MTSTYEKRLLPNKELNPKYIDVLGEDPPINGQKYVSISFISPEKILKNRDLYFFQEFIKQWDITEARKEMTDFIHYVSYNYGINIDELLKEYNAFIKDTSGKLKKHEKTTIEEDYASFLDVNETKLQKVFDEENKFKTSVRGIKIRGVYATEEIAQVKCKELREMDPDNNITYGEVGKWLAWDPDLYSTGNVEYLEPELNQLYQEKIKNEAKAKSYFEQRTLEMKKKAIEENMKKAEQTNTVVTQTINPETGELKGVRDYIDFESREVAPAPK
jgi:Family of unknown function (DUF5832)